MRYILLLLLTLCGLTACTPETDPIPPAPTATTELPPPVSETPVTDTTTVEATAEATPTLEVLSTETPATVLTDTTDTVELDCEIGAYPAFESSWEAANDTSICATRDEEVGDGAIQDFQNGTMVWVSGSDEEPAYIYVIHNDNTWQRFEDLFEEGDTENAGLTPPAGLLEPIRGFGLVWRDQLGGADATIGWALNQEAGQETVVQEFGEHTALAVSDRVYWLMGDGTWQ